jgi:hypothetical protein
LGFAGRDLKDANTTVCSTTNCWIYVSVHSAGSGKHRYSGFNELSLNYCQFLTASIALLGAHVLVDFDTGWRPSSLNSTTGSRCPDDCHREISPHRMVFVKHLSDGE